MNLIYTTRSDAKNTNLKREPIISLKIKLEYSLYSKQLVLHYINTLQTCIQLITKLNYVK